MVTCVPALTVHHVGALVPRWVLHNMSPRVSIFTLCTNFIFLFLAFFRYNKCLILLFTYILLLSIHFQHFRGLIYFLYKILFRLKVVSTLIFYELFLYLYSKLTIHMSSRDFKLHLHQKSTVFPHFFDKLQRQSLKQPHLF